MIEAARPAATSGTLPAAALTSATRIRGLTRMIILEGVRADRVGMLEAWQRGVFCALGEGDVDLDGFCKELADGSYDGWVVIEQDRVLANADELTAAIREQAANREWIRSHAGW